MGRQAEAPWSRFLRCWRHTIQCWYYQSGLLLKWASLTFPMVTFLLRKCPSMSAATGRHLLRPLFLRASYVKCRSYADLNTPSNCRYQGGVGRTTTTSSGDASSADTSRSQLLLVPRLDTSTPHCRRNAAFDAPRGAGCCMAC